jgi:hypothetical protein
MSLFRLLWTAAGKDVRPEGNGKRVSGAEVKREIF